MNKKLKLIIIFIICFLLTHIILSANEIIIEDFESNNLNWLTYCPYDIGHSMIRIRTNCCINDILNNNNNCLGIKQWFYRSAKNSCKINYKNDFLLPDNTISISLYVNSRNKEGIISIILKNELNEESKITLGNLNYKGWKKLSTNLELKKDIKYKIDSILIEYKNITGTVYLYIDHLTIKTIN